MIRGQTAALAQNADAMHESGLALDRAVADAPGVQPLRRHKKITRQLGYCYAFLYDKAAFNDVDLAVFHKALSAEAGFPFFRAYTPLTHSEVYSPHLKKRHQLSDAYVKAITPSRWKLPVVERAASEEAVIALWQVYGCTPDRAYLLTDAIAKVYEHRDELKGCEA